MIDAIYQETHGIPSRIIAHFPELNKGKESTEPLIILILAVAGLVTLALGVQWFTASRVVIEQGNPSAISDGGSRSRVIDLNPPFLSLPIGDNIDHLQESFLPAPQQDSHDVTPKAGQTTDQVVKRLLP